MKPMTNDLSNNFITLKLKGSPEDNGKVRLAEFRDFLLKVSDCLKKIDLKVSNKGTPSLYYRIADLQAQSASVTLEAVPYRLELDNSILVLNSFAEGSVLIQEKNSYHRDLTENYLRPFED